MLTQSVHIHAHTDELPMDIHVIEGERELSFMFWGMYFGERSRNTGASGFPHYTLSLSKIFFLFSWHPFTMGQNYQDI